MTQGTTSGSHWQPQRGPVASVAAKARAVKAVAVAGLLVGTAAFAATAPTADDAPRSAAHADSAGLAPTRTVAEAASRSAARSALTTPDVPGAAIQAPAVQAPAVRAPAVRAPAGGPAIHAVGVLGVKAVAKPKPKPKVATPASAALAAKLGTTVSTAPASGDTTAYSTGAYVGAGQALGLGSSAIAVYSAVRSAFGITSIGGYRAGDGGDHGTGQAVDVMTSSFAQGDAVASFAMAHAGSLSIKYVIWKQRIWFPGSGWRSMADRGSATQNHMDHVHISVN